MGGKAKAPTPPDPQQTIAAQTASNLETAKETSRLAKNNAKNFYGGATYTPDASAPGGYLYEETMSPAQQALAEQNQGLQGQALGVAGKTMGNIADVIGQPVSFDSAGNPVTSVDAEKMARMAAPTAGERVGDAAKGKLVGPAAMQGFTSATPDQLQTKLSSGILPSLKEVQNVPGIQRALDYSKLGALPQSNQDTLKQVQDAVYNRQAMYLDPQFQKEADKLSANLVQQGAPLGSEAHKQAMAEFADAKERAYSGARMEAIKAGGAEQSRQLADQLGIRQQGVGEINNQGAFVNSAQAQQYGQGANTVTANNAAANQGTAAQIALANQQNSAGQQNFQNQFAAQEQANKAAQANFENPMAQVLANNQTGTQDLSNVLASTGQRNAANQQDFSQNLTTTQQNNAAAQQDIQNLFANANLTNAQRQQAIQEIMTKRNIPLSEYSTLVSGAQPMLPQFGNAGNQGGENIAPTNVAGIIDSGYQNQVAATNANNAASGMLPQALLGLAGSALGGGSLGQIFKKA
jgi:hypothetical protein